jgi:hypothetical protein
MGFRGGTKTFCWVNESPRLLLLMLEVKRETKEETTVSFNNKVSFEVDDWKETEEYALSGLNSEDKLHQDERKPAAIPTNNPSVTKFAIAP